MLGNSIDLQFGDGTYTFALPLIQINEVQRKTGTGIGALYARTLKGVTLAGDQLMLVPKAAEFFALDVVEVVRHGLIGGAKGVVNGEPIEVTPTIATKLVDAYVLGRPLVEVWNIAVSVLHACIMGFEPPKKDEPPPQGAARKKSKKTAG